MVSKKEFPTMPEVMAHIEEFFSTDTDCELAFGPEFSKEELDAIKLYAEEHKLASRFFTSANDPKEDDHIVIYNRRSPQEIRDQVIEIGDDPKYYIIRPCSGQNYVKFALQADSQISKQDSKIFNSFWDAIKKDKQPPKGDAVPNPENESKPKPQRPSVKARKRQAQYSRPQESQRSPNKRPLQTRFEEFCRENVSWKGERQSQSRFGDRRQDNNPWQSYSRSEDRYFERDNSYNDRQNNSFNGRQNNSFNDGQNNSFNELRNSIFNDNQNNSFSISQFQNTLFDTEYPMPKRSKPKNSLPRVVHPLWHQCAPLIVVWPVTMQSQIEERRNVILEENFPTEYIKDDNGVAVMVTLPMRNGNQKKFCLSAGFNQKRATSDALDLIVKHSTVIKPSPAYLCDGSAPNFVRYNVPCQTNPRTYIILTKNDTGLLTEDKVHNILQTFQSSFNEDVFFDNYSFTFQEKTLLMEMAPKYELKVRHFGDASGVVNRWVCIYKKRPKEQILEEVLKMRGNHPKYMMTTDRLPPGVGLNIF